MKVTEKIMGMETAIEILDPTLPQDVDAVLEYFHVIDKTFSVYQKDSQLMRINTGRLRLENADPIVRKVLKLCENTRLITHGYFDPKIENLIDPAGLLKGFAIHEASVQLDKKGYRNFYIEVGGDIEIHGLKNGQLWKVGLINPVTKGKVIVVSLTNKGMATSGLAHTGLPVYNPVTRKVANIHKSITVIAQNAYEADRYSTAAYAMGFKALDFLEKVDNLEALIITGDGKELITSGFASYL